MSKARYIGWPIVLLACSLVLAFIITFLLHRPSMKVVAHWEQTPGIAYDGHGPYHLSVVEDDLDWRGFPLAVGRNYFIYAGRDSGTPSHGHMIKYSFHPDGSESIETFLGKAKVLWAPEGVTLELPSGHRLFIPQAMFTGGR